jgi:hypothetical protein
MRAALAVAVFVAVLLAALLLSVGYAYGAPNVDPRCQCVPQIGTGHAGPGWHRNAWTAGRHYGRHGR